MSAVNQSLRKAKVPRRKAQTSGKGIGIRRREGPLHEADCAGTIQHGFEIVERAVKVGLEGNANVRHVRTQPFVSRQHTVGALRAFGANHHVEPCRLGVLGDA